MGRFSIAAGIALLLLAPGARAEEQATFRQIIPGLDSAVLARFNYGQGFFDHRWQATGHADRTVSGLGPLFKAQSCAACHVRDGRGQPPGPGAPAVSGMVLAIGIPREADDGTWVTAPDPVYGRQLLDKATGSAQVEGRIKIDYTETEVTLAGGETVRLRAPRYRIADPAYGPLSPDAVLGPRVAPPVYGLGYVEAIDAADILANADPDDADGDGISGRANWVTDAATGDRRLGRFGWKASVAAIRDQTERAAALDMGLGSLAMVSAAGDCTEAQAECLASVGPDAELEFDEKTAKLVEFYLRHLAVPAERDADDPEILRGGELFAQAGCSACHILEFTTAASAKPAYFAAQTIRPYSDFLLHDMGEGLADGLPALRAGLSEWRTPPLWGIGLTEAVNGHTYFLHDGRARNLQEAILWHGGEATKSRDAYRALAAEDRAALLAFLGSL